MTTSDEQIVNHALSGIAFYHRDINLSDVLTQQYKIGHILQHSESLAVSPQFGGLVANTRYIIASAHTTTDNQEITNIPSNALFKVLDILFINQRTQILLLHLPEEAVQIFTTQRIPFEDKLLETHRQIFIEHTYQPPVPELQTEAWRAQTASPIGMDDIGKLYYDYTPPMTTEHTTKKVNQYKAGAEPNTRHKKSFWKKLFG